MVRVKRGSVARKKRKKILKIAKGFKGAHSSLFRTAKQQVMKALRYAYSGRKQKKRHYRRLWITRINAGLIDYKISYSRFMNLLKKSDIALNRKILSQLIILDNQTFSKLVSII
jgi:large subunit ribosomal protein L20